MDNPTKAADEKFCSSCAAAIKSAAEICPKCGVRQMAAPTGGGRSRVGAALFAFFLGGLGVHKFYLGQAGMGVVYLLFCWTCIPALVGFVEAIVFLTMTDRAFAARYDK